MNVGDQGLRVSQPPSRGSGSGSGNGSSSSGSSGSSSSGRNNTVDLSKQTNSGNTRHFPRIISLSLSLSMPTGTEFLSSLSPLRPLSRSRTGTRGHLSGRWSVNKHLASGHSARGPM
jgi:hypothetical protein